MSSTVEVLENKEENVKLIQTLCDTDGTLEGPIDLDINKMKIMELEPLKWTHIDKPPRKLKITNTGHTVILSAKWQQDIRPYVSGGPFTVNYIFSQVHFHWGENEMVGSEHTIDGANMPMELHVVLYKDEYESLELALRRPGGVCVVVYFCKLQNDPNDFMEEIVRNLSAIRTADSSVRIAPSSLSNFLIHFTDDYFLYWGSIITTSNIHNILWLICRKPIGISVNQVIEFRKLYSQCGGPILSNVRQRKPLKGRNVFHVCPSGSLYASLLPIPRNYNYKRMSLMSRREDGSITEVHAVDNTRHLPLYQ